MNRSASLFTPKRSLVPKNSRQPILLLLLFLLSALAAAVVSMTPFFRSRGSVLTSVVSGLWGSLRSSNLLNLSDTQMRTPTTSTATTTTTCAAANGIGRSMQSRRFPKLVLDQNGSITNERRRRNIIYYKIHLIVLVHGWMGNSKELNYLETALKRKAAEILREESHSNNNSSSNNKQQRNVVLIHSAVSNNEQTSDGVAAGGKRLAAEINDWIDDILTQQQQQQSQQGSVNNNIASSGISLSLVGNSLGGLYARYALKDIQWSRPSSTLSPASTTNNNKPKESQQEQKNQQQQRAIPLTLKAAAAANIDSDGVVTVPTIIEPAVFCTTATPHLGVQSPHTYLPLGKWGEYITANVMGETGRDLFRRSTLLQDMVTDQSFTGPMLRFRKRLAIANGYNTDLQVPCSTAAFLSKTNSIHKRVAMNTASATVATTATATADRSLPQDGDDEREKVLSLVALTVETEQHPDVFQVQVLAPADEVLSSEELAVRLDAMGWTKVFCDFRDGLFTVSIPSLWPFSRPPAASGEARTTTTTVNQGNNDDDDDDVYTSTELWERFATFFTDGKIHAPFGHSIMVANAKTDAYARWNAAGQPLMEKMADDLLREIIVRNDDDNVSDKPLDK